ncbi:MAG TPA: FHA domain-containing protein, partial [Chloroflexota bacterium]
MAELIIMYGDSRPPVHCRIEKPKVVLGRDPSCDICLDPGDVSTSRRHAQISLSSGTYLIEDLGSKNGTLVNDQVRPSAKLAHGDRVTLGTVKIVFHDRDPTTTTSVILADTLPRSESSSFSGRDNELALSQQRLKMLYDLSAQ